MNDHYFSQKPVSKKRPNIVNYTLGVHDFKFHTSSSVFSRKYVDKGTDLLLKKVRISDPSSILDIGCGYGPVGIVLKKQYPDSTITMSDINERAIELARRNLKVNKVQAKVIKCNLFEKIPDKFDTILTNPPQHAGKKVCIQIIKESLDHLNKKGTLQLVARHQKGGKSLSKIMDETFGNLDTLGRQSGFHLYISEKV